MNDTKNQCEELSLDSITTDPKIFALEENTEYLKPITGQIADKLNQIISKDEHLKSSYKTVSIALLLDNVYDIAFPPGFAEGQNLPKFSYKDEGLIGVCADTNNSEIFVLDTAQETLNVNNAKIKTKKDLRWLPQFCRNIQNAKIKFLFVAPIVTQNDIVGSIQISYAGNYNLNKVKEFLDGCKSKLLWMLRAEQNRILSTIRTAETMINALEGKNTFQAEHSKNVAALVKAILYLFNKKSEHPTNVTNELRGLGIVRAQTAALLHDIGKVAMSNEGLDYNKFKDLGDRSMRELHAYFSHSVLASSPLTAGLANLAGYHHEKINGRGYPFGVKLSKVEESELIQLIAFADTYDSHARERPGAKEKRKQHDAVMKSIADIRGKKIDKEIFDAIKNVLSDNNLEFQRVFAKEPQLSKVIILPDKQGNADKNNNNATKTKYLSDTESEDLDDFLNETGRHKWVTVVMIENLGTDPNKPFNSLLMDKAKNRKNNKKVKMTLSGNAPKWWIHEELYWEIFVQSCTNPPSFLLFIRSIKNIASATTYALCESMADSLGPGVKMAAQILTPSDAPPLKDVEAKLRKKLESLNPQKDRWQLLPPWGIDIKKKQND